MIYLTPDQLDTLEDVAFNHDAEVRTSYSGRGMYGAKCIGLVLDRGSDIIHIALDIAERDEDLASLIRDSSAAYDSMGLSTITYWPNLGIEANNDEEGQL